MTQSVDPCCHWMSARLNWSCSTHEDPWDCPDAVLVRTQTGLGIPIRDGGQSYITIDYCPWCGGQLF